MPESFGVSLKFPSSRWESGTTLAFEFTILGVAVTAGPKQVIRVRGSTEWTGHLGSGGHALRELFIDEGLRGDDVVEDVVWKAWEAWRTGSDPDARVQAVASLSSFRDRVAFGARNGRG